MNKITISAVILAHEKNDALERCLKSLDWCDEILLIIDYLLDSDNPICL